MTIPIRTLPALFGVFVLAGCPEKKPPPVPDAPRPKPIPKAPVDPAVADIVYDANAPTDPARMPKPPEDKPAEVLVRHILVKYLSAKNAVGVTRSKQAARRRAELLVKVARQRGADFVQLARKYSDEPAAKRGELHEVAPYEEGVDRAGFDLGVGQVSAVVEAPTGLYIVRRAEVEELCSAHILVIYKGTELAPVGLKRTKAEARSKAERLLKQVQKGKASFSVLAARYSDSPSGSLRGGVIAPLIAEKTKEVMKPYLEALTKTKVGEVHPEVVETKYGFHVIKRLALRKVYVQHLLVAHNESGKFKPKKPRDKWTAKALAEKLRKKAVAAGADFDALVREHSDDHETVSKGGRLPPSAPGEMHPRLEQFSFALQVGQVSQVVETEFGAHIIKRLR